MEKKMNEKELQERIEDIKLNINRKESYLNVGDKVWIVSSDGYLLHTDVVERVTEFYAIIDGRQYWRHATDGKHRFRNNYLQFAMTPENGRDYVVYYPKDFKDE